MNSVLADTPAFPELAGTAPPLIEFPLRVPLSDQAAEAIRRAIGRGAWSDYLPSERRLCEMCQVSRPTIRMALHTLAEDGLIAIQQRQRNRILQPERGACAAPSRTVAIITHDTSARIPSLVFLGLNEMRANLHEHGFGTEIFVCGARGGSAQRKRIEQFIRDNRIVCCVLVSVSREIQEWFAFHSVPAVAFGSCYDNVRLPSVDVDYRSVGRHAAGTFLSKGHQRLGLIIPDSKGPGDLATEAGFLEALEHQSPGQSAQGVIARHDATVKGLRAQLHALCRSPERPTALLVAKSQWTLIVLFDLLKLGFSVPGDISVIARDRDDIFRMISPPVAHYTFEAEALSSRLARLLLKVVSRGSRRPEASIILPTFFPGGTVRPPPARPDARSGRSAA